MILLKKYLYLFIFSLLGLSFCYSQQLTPEIKNYGIYEYEAGNQNWGIDLDINNVIYAANNKGLLRFTGENWTLHKLPNKTIVRSIMVDGDKIYTGSFEEFGYWEYDQFGDLNYKSLKHLFPKSFEFKSDEFWQITKHKEKIIFRSFRGVFVYEYNEIKLVPNSSDVSAISIYEDKVIISSFKYGLLELKENQLKPFLPLKNIEKFQSVNIIESDDNKKLFIYEDEKGGYFYFNEQLKALPDYINKLLKQNILNKVEFIENNKIAFGTIKNGVYVYNLNSRNLQHINKEKGLANNTVLSIVSNDQELWVGLDNGIGQLSLDDAYLFYTDYTGTLATVYDVAFFNNKYYLASNTGLYSFTENNKLELIKGSEGHIWNLSALNDKKLLYGHNKGNYFLENEQIENVFNESGIFCHIEIPNKNNQFLVGAYNGIKQLKFLNDEIIKNSISNIDFPINNIVFESNNIIWATHPYKGIYRIHLDSTYSKAISVKNYYSFKGFKDYKTNVYSVDSNIIFYNNNKWFTYFKKNDSIGLYDRFKKFNNQRLIKSNNNLNWFVNRNEGVLNIMDSDYKTIHTIDNSFIKNRFVHNYEKHEKINDSLEAVNLVDGFVIFNMNLVKDKKNKPKNAPIIDKIYYKEKKFPINNLNAFTIPYKKAQYLSFEIYTPGQYNILHTYHLSGKINQSDNVKDGKFVLQNLKYGSYNLKIVSTGNNNSSYKHISFTVLPPWYFSTSMIIVYIFITISLILLTIWLNFRRIKRHELKLKRLHIEKMREKIIELEKQGLKKEVKAKKRELLNLTDAIIRKNEIIMVIVNELERLFNNSSDQHKRTKTILDKSKQNIKSSQDWKIFEANFNDLNQEFFKKLININTKLTTKDLRLCAYIKTGLSSKQIAPLMGISLKGIELHRYRLRKKLSIQAKDTLVSFLRRF